MSDATPLEKRSALAAACSVFDTTCDEDRAKGAPKTPQESDARLRQMIDALPQRPAIEDEDANRWLGITRSRAIERMTLEFGEGGFSVKDVHDHISWHIRRASAIGGSESGTVVKHFDGKVGSFTNAANIVSEKLLRFAPQSSTPEMQRGIRAEPWLQKIYQENTGAVTIDEHLNGLRGYRWDKLPFVVGTPDDIVRMPSGEVKIIDYKAPSLDVFKTYERDGISEDYIAQVHHYGLLCRANGIDFDAMSLEVFHPGHFEVVSFDVPINPELMKDISKRCGNLWMNNVMQGVVPDVPGIGDIQIDDDILPKLGREAAVLKLLGQKIDEMQKQVVDRISMIVSEHDPLAAGNVPFGASTLRRSRKWDEEQVLDAAEAAGLDVSIYKKTSKTVDSAKATEILKDLHAALESGDPIDGLLDDIRVGLPMKVSYDCEAISEVMMAENIDIRQHAKASDTFALTTKKKGPEYEERMDIQAQIVPLLEGIDTVVGQIVDGTLDLDAPDGP